jgi:Na+/melibiose symporter-like transporter
MIIITAICFALFFVEIHRFNVKWKLDFKPFNCGSCLAAWTAVGLYLLPTIVTEIAFVMFVSGVLAPIGRQAMEFIWKYFSHKTI